MKLIFSEYTPDYQKYHFPYQIWLKKEPGDKVAEIYARGFLPMRHRPGLYYLCRSLRVDLAKFSPSSENRRILRKTEAFHYQVLPLPQPGQCSSGAFPADEAVYAFCQRYLESRFGQSPISEAGLKSIFRSGIFSHVFVWSEGEKVTGYAVCLVNDDLLHYAHVFYDPSYAAQNLGARMILEAVTWAKAEGKQYAYLGTCYNQSAFYKLEFSGVEFFNGVGWSSDLEELKWLVSRSNDNHLLNDSEYLGRFGPLGKLLNTPGVK